MLGGAVAGFVSAGVASPAFAQSAFDKFQAFNADSERAIDYEAFDTLMDRFSFKRGSRTNVFYAGLRPQGVIFLNQFTNALANIQPASFSRDEQLAYWLNLRNILIVRAIAADDPGRTIKRERGDAANPGEMWTRKRVTVQEVPVSIADIEQEILLRHFADDANVLYGLYQGSKGGPALRRTAFRGASIRDDLKEEGAKYVNARRSVRVKSGTASVSAVYLWYKEALFGGDDGAVVAHLQSLAEGRLQNSLSDATSISAAKFDYALDEHVVRQQRQVGAGGLGRQAPSGGGS